VRPMARLVTIRCTRAEAAQLLAYLTERDRGAAGGWYFGERKDFDRRHTSLKSMLEKVLAENHVENDFHRVKATPITEGFRASCTCGWRGPIRAGNRASVWRVARDDATDHFKEIKRQRADSAKPQRSGD
jgi:hypothetical protein